MQSVENPSMTAVKFHHLTSSEVRRVVLQKVLRLEVRHTTVSPLQYNDTEEVLRVTFNLII